MKMHHMRMETKPSKPVKADKRRHITIYGLMYYFGTERAKKCAKYLHRCLPRLYKKPTINVYYDYEWVDVVKELQQEYGGKYRKMMHLKKPVIIFFNDKYVGDHRAIIHYVIMEHKILPDLPFPNLFPDFTDLLPKNSSKDYVYLDVRVGDLDDYVVGKLVFELHTDVVPDTCKFFLNLCKPFGEKMYGTSKPGWKFSYLGTTFHRICGNSFVQGGKIKGCDIRIKDENFAIKHSRRGVLSICNQGGNNSTTQFCISLKENAWLDGEVVAFGQLIFGEPILTAIQDVPVYYQRPLNEILVVGCGIIPSYKERQEYDFTWKMEKLKENINTNVEELRLKRLQDIKDFEENVKNFLDMQETGRSVEYMYLEKVDIKSEKLMDETEGEQEEEEKEEEEEEEVICEGEDQQRTVRKLDFTLEQFMVQHRDKNAISLTNMMTKFIDIIVENIDYAAPSDQTEPLDYIPKMVIRDSSDVRDAPSDEFLEERFNAGLYSVPEYIRRLLVKTFEDLTPSQLKLIGQEAREILKEAGIDDSTLRLVGSENVMSGLVLAIIDVGTRYSMESGGTGVQEAFTEIRNDTVRVLKQRGPEVIRHMIASTTPDVSLTAVSASRAGNTSANTM